MIPFFGFNPDNTRRKEIIFILSSALSKEFNDQPHYTDQKRSPCTILIAYDWTHFDIPPIRDS
jgi:hypothetical protein